MRAVAGRSSARRISAIVLTTGCNTTIHYQSIAPLHLTASPPQVHGHLPTSQAEEWPPQSWFSGAFICWARITATSIAGGRQHAAIGRRGSVGIQSQCRRHFSVSRFEGCYIIIIFIQGLLLLGFVQLLLLLLLYLLQLLCSSAQHAAHATVHRLAPPQPPLPACHS